MITLKINEPLRSAPITIIEVFYEPKRPTPIALVTLEITRGAETRIVKTRLDRGKRWFIDNQVNEEIKALIVANTPIIVAIVEEHITRSRRPSA